MSLFHHEDQTSSFFSPSIFLHFFLLYFSFQYKSVIFFNLIIIFSKLRHNGVFNLCIDCNLQQNTKVKFYWISTTVKRNGKCERFARMQQMAGPNECIYVYKIKRDQAKYGFKCWTYHRIPLHSSRWRLKFYHGLHACAAPSSCECQCKCKALILIWLEVSFQRRMKTIVWVFFSFSIIIISAGGGGGTFKASEHKRHWDSAACTARSKPHPNTMISVLLTVAVT